MFVCSFGIVSVVIQTYSLIPSRSLRSRLFSLRSKNPLLLVKTRCLGLLLLWMFFSCMWFWSPHSVWKPSCTHTSSCLGLNPQQLWSRRLWIWKTKLLFPQRILVVGVLRIQQLIYDFSDQYTWSSSAFRQCLMTLRACLAPDNLNLQYRLTFILPETTS